MHIKLGLAPLQTPNRNPRGPNFTTPLSDTTVPAIKVKVKGAHTASHPDTGWCATGSPCACLMGLILHFFDHRLRHKRLQTTLNVWALRHTALDRTQSSKRVFQSVQRV